MILVNCLLIKSKSSDGLPAEVLTGRLFWLHYFLPQVLVNITDKIDKGGTIAIRTTKLSANINIIGDKIKNIPPMHIRTLFMLYVSFSSLVDVLYPAIKLSPLPNKIITARTRTISEIISSNINCAVILKDSDYLIR
jgi:hypothetical protein